LYWLVLAAAGWAAGGLLFLLGFGGAADAVWAALTVAAVIPAAWWVADAARHRRLGVDVVALLALVGTLVVGEYFAGAVIAVMLASGRALEAGAALAHVASCAPCSSARPASCTATKAASSRRRRSTTCSPVISLWCNRGRWFPSTGWSNATSPSSTRAR
jgi:cation transport ATPase